MAERLVKDPLLVRKARLIRQSEMLRRNFQAEAGNLRGTAEWIEKGYGFFRAAGGIRKWATLNLKRVKKRNSFVNILRGCEAGVQIWRNFKRGRFE